MTRSNVHGGIACLALILAALWIPTPPASAARNSVTRAEQPADGPEGLGRAHPPAVNAASRSLRKERIYSIEDIGQGIKRLVHAELDGSYDLEVDVLYPRASITVPHGDVRARIVPVRARDQLGRRSFLIVFLVDGREVERVRALADVSAQASVVVPVRMIRPGETITEEDLTQKTIRLTSTTQRLTLDMDHVLGKRTTRPLRPNAPIPASALAEPYAVKKGDRVTIQFKRGGLLILASGIIKASGQLGETLTVTNLDSRREVRARVVAPGLVEVDF